MRLIGSFENEEKAHAFYAYLSSNSIASRFEFQIDPKTKKPSFLVWSIDEDQLDKAIEALKRFEESPDHPDFALPKKRSAYPEPSAPIAPPKPPGPQSIKVRINFRNRPNLKTPLTYFLLVLCSLLFIMNSIEESKMVKEDGPIGAMLTLTPLQRLLFFEDPPSIAILDKLLKDYDLKDVKKIDELPSGAQALLIQAETTPSWKGIYDLIIHRFPTSDRPVSLFINIREGQIWRLITPTFLHSGLLHILFNMAWLLILGKQLEVRIGKWRMILFVLITGILANIAQYLMSGPFFLGFSGVIVGMAGFIWMRQRLAPWEGYPLNRPTEIFILLFVGAMFILSIIAFFLQLFKVTEMMPTMANTAHIIGGVIGILLARTPYFSRIKA